MDWIAARSYYVAYGSINRFDSIVFFYNYFFTWTIGILGSLTLPIFFLFAPFIFHTQRTWHFFLISFVCLFNMFSLSIQPYMLSGLGEPYLSFHSCRFMVYISTLTKPIGLYLTVLFSVERIWTKILANLILPTNQQRLLFRRLCLLLICLGISLILSIRLYEILKLIQKNPSDSNSSQNTNQNNNSTDRQLNFQYCYRSMNIETYATILSFYFLHYWFEYVIFTLIILALLSLMIYHYCLPYFQYRSFPHLSMNTKFYFSLASCVILFEIPLQVVHRFIIPVENNNTDKQVNYLQIMLFIYNIRCIYFPLIICITTCPSFKQRLYEFFIHQSYLEHLNENDHCNAMIDPSEASFSSSQRTFVKTNNNEHFDT